MPVPAQLATYLNHRGVRYETQPYEYRTDKVEAARAAHVPPQQFAKSVISEDAEGCVMTVVPANTQLMLGKVRQLLHRAHLQPADGDRIASRFGDCDHGALPALGMAWGIETLVDERLDASPVVYIEGGDGERLLRMSHEQFHTLMLAARHGRFCIE